MEIQSEVVKSERCIICANDSYQRLYHFDHHVILQNQDLHFEQHILLCTSCGLARVELNDTYSDGNLSAYYSRIPRTPIDFSDISHSDPRLIYAKQRINHLRGLCAGKEYLEIGFGDGQAILEAVNQGFRVTAIDPSESYGYVNELLKERGVEVVSGMLDASTDFGRKFDVVAAFLVLEHVKDPLAFLLNCKRQLNAEGILVIEVPDVRNYPAFLSDTILTFEHIYHYTHETIEALGAIAGMELVDFHSPGMSYPFTLTAVFRVSEPRPITVPHAAIIVQTAFGEYFKNMQRYRSALRSAVESHFGRKKEGEVYAVFGLGNFTQVLESEYDFWDTIDFIVDDTPEKTGKEHREKKIYPSESLRTYLPDKLLVGSESFFELISKRVKILSPKTRCINIRQLAIEHIKNHSL